VCLKRPELAKISIFKGKPLKIPIPNGRVFPGVGGPSGMSSTVQHLETQNNFTKSSMPGAVFDEMVKSASNLGWLAPVALCSQNIENSGEHSPMYRRPRGTPSELPPGRRLEEAVTF
jgi:hypothetical protein